jgi:hypothetical protein
MNEALPVPTEGPAPGALIRAIGFCLARTRFSVLILLAGFALLLVDQGRDLLIASAEESWWHQIFLVSMAWLWAFSLWFWCRALLNVRYADPPTYKPYYNLARLWVPRVLGALAFVAVILGALAAGQIGLAAWMLGGLVAFLVIVIGRRAAVAQVIRYRNPSLNRFAVAFKADEIGPHGEPPYEALSGSLGITQNRAVAPRSWPFRTWIALTMFLTFLVLATFGIFAPVFLGAQIHTLALFFLWGASWLPLGSYLSYYLETKGVPALTTLGLIALVSSFFNDNHEIRQATNGASPDTRPTVTKALGTWAATNGVTPNTPTATPFVVVATAGGGIRAAYWTATVLGSAHDQDPVLFPKRVFAISGVSGGSVGATVYRALLEVSPDDLSHCGTGIRECAQSVVGEDSLAALSAALLYPDLAQRFWPLPMFPDRGEALEKAWEHAFYVHTLDDRLNSQTIATLRHEGRPALFLNSTWVDSGRRIVGSNLKFAKSTDDAIEARAFARSNDELAMLGRDLRLSTAAHNSARFPIVSPAGRWNDKDGNTLRLQDGGLFENYGAESALEILNLACQYFTCNSPDKNQPGKHGLIRPVIVLIGSDPEEPDDLARSHVLKTIQFAYEVRSTISAFENVRVGRGDEAASRLQAWPDRQDLQFIRFRMCPAAGQTVSPPLGWAISGAAKAAIRGYLSATSTQDPCTNGNLASLQRLTSTLKGSEIATVTR